MHIHNIRKVPLTMIDINEFKEEVTQYQNRIIAINKRKRVYEERIEKIGELYVPEYNIVELRDAIKDIKIYQNKILQCRDEAIKAIEADIQKNIKEINKWRGILKDDMLPEQKRIVES